MHTQKATDTYQIHTSACAHSHNRVIKAFPLYFASKGFQPRGNDLNLPVTLTVKMILILYVKMENHNHKDILNQNLVTMIARIFNMFPVTVKIMEDKSKVICIIKEIVYKHHFYDMNEYFICNFEL